MFLAWKKAQVLGCFDIACGGVLCGVSTADPCNGEDDCEDADVDGNQSIALPLSGVDGVGQVLECHVPP